MSPDDKSVLTRGVDAGKVDTIVPATGLAHGWRKMDKETG